jgi:hypothetical protein
LELRAQADEEAKKDPTFEQFQNQYMDHILGKVKPEDRTAGRPITAAYDAESSKAGRGGTGLSANALEEDEKNRKSEVGKRQS